MRCRTCPHDVTTHNVRGCRACRCVSTASHKDQAYDVWADPARVPLLRILDPDATYEGRGDWRRRLHCPIALWLWDRVKHDTMLNGSGVYRMLYPAWPWG